MVMMPQPPLIIWALLTILGGVDSVEISGCCDQGQTLSLATQTCEDSDDITNKTHFTPKIFSFAAEAFVQETIELSGDSGIPQCSDGQVILSSGYLNLNTLLSIHTIFSSDWSGAGDPRCQGGGGGLGHHRRGRQPLHHLGRLGAQGVLCRGDARWAGGCLL